jgi:hypothetical protein
MVVKLDINLSVEDHVRRLETVGYSLLSVREIIEMVNDHRYRKLTT